MSISSTLRSPNSTIRASSALTDSVYRGKPSENAEGYKEGWYHKYISVGVLEMELRHLNPEDQKLKEKTMIETVREVVKNAQLVGYMSPKLFHSTGVDHVPISRAGIPTSLMFYRDLQSILCHPSRMSEEQKTRMQNHYINDIRYAYTRHVSYMQNERSAKQVPDVEWEEAVAMRSHQLVEDITKHLRRMKKEHAHNAPAMDAEPYKVKVEADLDTTWQLILKEIVTSVHRADMFCTTTDWQVIYNELRNEIFRMENYLLLRSIIEQMRNKIWKNFRSHEHLRALFPRDLDHLQALGIVLSKSDQRYVEILAGRPTATPVAGSYTGSVQRRTVPKGAKGSTPRISKEDVILNKEIVETTLSFQRDSACDRCKHSRISISDLQTANHCKALVFRFTACESHRDDIHAIHPAIQSHFHPSYVVGDTGRATWTSYLYQVRNKCRCTTCKEAYDSDQPRFKMDLVVSAVGTVFKKLTSKSSRKKKQDGAAGDARRTLVYEDGENGQQQQQSAGGGGQDDQSNLSPSAPPPEDNGTGANGQGDGSGDQHSGGGGGGEGGGGSDRGNDNNGNRGDDRDDDLDEDEGDEDEDELRVVAGGGGDPNGSDPSSSDDESDRGRGRRSRRGSHRSHSADSTRRRRSRSARARSRTPSPRRHRSAAPTVQPVITQAAPTLKGEGCPIFDGNVYNYPKWRAQVTAVYKSGHIPNARMHAQILNHLAGEPRILVDTVEIDEFTSTWTVLDLLDGDYNKPWLASKLLIEQLYQLKAPEFALKTSQQVLTSRQYLMHLRKIKAALAHVPDANSDLKTMLDKVILTLPIKLVLKWEDRCQETARNKHSHLYVGCSKEYFRQNQKFQDERLDDLITTLDDHLTRSKTVIDRVGKDGYLNPTNVAASAAEALTQQDKRLKNMRHIGNKPQQDDSYQPASKNQQQNKNQGRVKSYSTGQLPQNKSQQSKPQHSQQNRPQQNQQRPPPGKGGQADKPKGPPPGQPQVWKKECYICGAKDEHWPAQCSNPTKRTPTSILKSCIRHKACYNCLRKDADHIAQVCTMGKCQADGCQQKHHTLLHGADFHRIRELQQEVNDKVEKVAQARATKAQAKATTEADSNDQSLATGQNASKKNKKNKRSAPSAPKGKPHQQQGANAITQQDTSKGEVNRVAFAPQDSQK